MSKKKKKDQKLVPMTGKGTGAFGVKSGDITIHTSGDRIKKAKQGGEAQDNGAS
jgi:hypothetical protein